MITADSKTFFIIYGRGVGERIIALNCDLVVMFLLELLNFTIQHFFGRAVHDKFNRGNRSIKFLVRGPLFFFLASFKELIFNYL